MAGKNNVFVDTWGWLALGHAKDPWHSEVTSLFRKLTDDGWAFYTSDYVLDEFMKIPDIS